MFKKKVFINIMKIFIFLLSTIVFQLNPVYANSEYVQKKNKAPFYLFLKFPELENKFPRIPLVEEITPIEVMDGLERELGWPVGRGRILVKRDDLSHKQLGGNKARKLEFILGQAKKDGIKKVVTAGMWGSNHAYATALAFKEADFEVELLLGPQPVTQNVQEKLLADFALGAKLNYHSSKLSMGLSLAKNYIKSFFQKDLLYVPPGGTEAISTLGYANAYLELIEQSKTIGAPDHIFVPMGTAGTSAGLWLGSCLAGTMKEITIHAVGISHDFLSNGKLVEKTAKKSYELIKKSLTTEGLKALPDCEFKLGNGLVYTKDYSKPGYGKANDKVFYGMDLAKKFGHLKLDQTYSGKAFWAMIDFIEYSKLNHPKDAPKVLFWMTYNSHSLQEVIDSYAWIDPTKKWLELPKAFHKLFNSDKNSKLP